MAKVGRVYISSDARKPKPWFKEWPDDSVIEEIKAYIAREGTPYRWRGHTHTKPPKGAEVRYLEEFCLPAPFRNNRAMWSPCPCCSDDVPKFKGTDKRPAKIAWFPNEAAIRLIGHDCFSALNEQGHQEALGELRQRQKRKKHEQFLINNLRLLPEALFAIDANMEIAAALAESRGQLFAKLRALPSFRFVESLREGKLRVVEVLVKTVVMPDKSEKRVRKEFERIYASIPGCELIEAARQDPSEKLQRAHRMLDGIDVNADVLSVSQVEIGKMAKAFAKGLQLATEATHEVAEMRKFFSAETISTLRTWGKRSDTILPMHVEVVGSNFYLGPNENQKIRVEVLPILFERLSKIPVPGSGSSVRAVSRDVA